MGRKTTSKFYKTDFAKHHRTSDLKAIKLSNQFTVLVCIVREKVGVVGIVVGKVGCLTAVV